MGIKNGVHFCDFCDFCGRLAPEVRSLIVSPLQDNHGAICSKCIPLAVTVLLDAEEDEIDTTAELPLQPK